MNTVVDKVRLGDPDIASIVLGQSPPSSAYNTAREGLPFFQGKADFGLLHPVPRIWCSAGARFAEAGDTLMSVRAPVGDVNVADGDCVIGRGIAAIRAGSRVDRQYLYFALTNAKPALESRATGSTFQSINKNALAELEIPLHSYADQISIARVLGKLVAAIERETRVVELAMALKDAAMESLFTRGLRGDAQKDTEIGLVPATWAVVPFESAREWLQYGTSARCSYEPTEFPVLRIPNIESGRVSAADIKFAALGAQEANRYRLKHDDLLFIRTNGVLARLGACAVFSGDPKGALFASYLIRARLKLDRIDPYFAAYFFGSERGTAIVAGRATPAADGKYNLNTGTIDGLSIPLPPTLDEQREIVAILDAIDRKIDLHCRKRTVLDELFKALLHKLMTGEIWVADLDLSALESKVEAKPPA